MAAILTSLLMLNIIRNSMDVISQLGLRKFIALCLATALVYFGKIGEYSWLVVTLTYMGLNVAEKYLENRSKV